MIVKNDKLTPCLLKLLININRIFICCFNSNYSNLMSNKIAKHVALTENMQINCILHNLK